MTGPKEKAYDEKISPLINQILDICDQHKISMFANFELDKDDDGISLNCTSSRIGPDYDTSDKLYVAYAMLGPPQE